jgi:hypothetical protein
MIVFLNKGKQWLSHIRWHSVSTGVLFQAQLMHVHRGCCFISCRSGHAVTSNQGLWFGSLHLETKCERTRKPWRPVTSFMKPIAACPHISPCVHGQRVVKLCFCLFLVGSLGWVASMNHWNSNKGVGDFSPDSSRRTPLFGESTGKSKLGVEVFRAIGLLKRLCNHPLLAAKTEARQRSWR